MSSPLELALIEAIDDNDILQLRKYIHICDSLHKGISEINGYTEKDLPSDEKYEEALKQLKEFEQLETIMQSKIIPIEDYNPNVNTSMMTDSAKATRNTLIFMDGIQITDTIPNIKNVILMPKFDGCSIGSEFIKIDNEFKISRAHTRGSDNLNGKRQCQDKTEYLQEVSASLLKKLNKQCNKDIIINITYKDITKIGNENKPLKTEINLKNIDYMIIRGEFVSNDKNNINIETLPHTQVGLAAGAINALTDKFNEYKEYLTYKPFELPLIRTREENKQGDEIINEYIPTQSSALKILKKLSLIDYPYYESEEINNETDMEDLLSTFETEITEPLDGIVYCSKYWTYPNNKNEISTKVNYGKYKWKRHNNKQTRLIDIEYSIGKTGKINPSLILKGVQINNKTYKQAKTTFNHIQEFIDQCKDVNTVFGKGLICNLELKQDISPQITEIYPSASKVEEEIKIIKNCPYCCCKLTKETKQTKKERIINIFCENDECPGVLVQKAKDFFKQIGFKGISEKTLSNSNYKDFEIFYNEIDETKKTKLYNIFVNMSIGTYLISTSLVTKQKLEGFLNKYDIENNDNMLLLLTSKKGKKLRNDLYNDYGYFINNLTESIINIYLNNK